MVLDLTPAPMRFSIAEGLTGVVSTVEAFMVEVSTAGDPMAAGSMVEVTEDAGNC